MPVQYEIVDPATSTLQYEYLQAKIVALHTGIYLAEIVFIVVGAIMVSKVLTWRNWASELFESYIHRRPK